MSDDTTVDESATDPGTEPAPDPSPAEAPRQEVEQAPVEEQDAGSPPSEGAKQPEAGETFFDPRSVPEELQPAYKQMQAAFTKKTQLISQHRQKIEEYDRFMANPQASIMQMAAQYGINLNQQAPGEAPQENAEWEPQTWEDVIAKTREETRQSVMQELKPYLDEVNTIKRSKIESDLDSAIPEWRQYEDEMAQALQQHPTLATDPVKLARLVMPEELLESRATQAALKKLQAKQQSSNVGRGSVSQTVDTGAPPPGMSFKEAYEWSKRHLEKQGKLYLKPG